MNDNVHRQMAHGAGWMVLFKFAERSLGLISTLILVRVLSPADFGIVAMAMSFIFMAELLTAFAFDVALIQNQDANEEHYHTAWTLNLLLGALIAVVMVSSATAISNFYKRPEVFWVVCALALGPLITGFENIGVVAFRKEMQFRREFLFQLCRKMVGFLVVVPLAIFLQSYWALVAGTLAGRLCGTVISFFVHPFRPRFSLAQVRGLLGFSKWLLINNVVSFLKERSGDFVIGRFLGATPLGVYTVSYEFASMPTTELSAPINRALFPGFARIAKDVGAMRAAYGKAIGILAMLAIPAAAGIFATAPFLVPVILGTKWLDSVHLMEILALNGGLLMFHSSIAIVLMANGRPDRIARTNAWSVAMLLLLFGLLVPGYGITGAAYAAVCASIFTTPLYLIEIHRIIGIPASEFVRLSARPAAAAFVMAGLVRLTLPDWSSSMSTVESIAWLTGALLFGMATYATAVLLLWVASGRPEGAERVLLKQLREWLLNRRLAPASILGES